VGRQIVMLIVALMMILVCGCVEIEEPSPEYKETTPSYAPGYETNYLRADRFGFVCFDELAISDLNLGWVRPHPGPFVWGKLESEEGEFDFSQSDNVVKRAQEMGIEILATIWPFADWDQKKWGDIDRFVEEDFPDLPTSRYKPYDMQEYKKFVKKLVERYDGDGIDDMPGLKKPIKYWEVLNEPSTGFTNELRGKNKGFFKGDADDYFEILKVTYEAIKEANPEAKVLNGGMVPLPQENEEPAFYDFWSRVFELGGGNYIDIVNFHSFSPYEDAKMLKDFFGEYIGEKPLWVTEFSSPDEQGYVNALKSFAEGVERIFYTSYRAFPDSPEDLLAGSLIDLQGNKKPSYYAVKTMHALVGSFDEVEKLNEDIYRFQSDNLTVYLLWSSFESISGDLDGKVLIVSITGEASVTNADGIEIKDCPVYIVVADEQELEKVLQSLEEITGSEVKSAEASSEEETTAIKPFATRFGCWGHKHDEYSYTPGYGWIKPHPGPFNRYFIEREKGVYDFSTCDEGVRIAQETGAEIVATTWPYAEWDEKAYEGREGYGKATGDGPFAYVLPSSRFKPYDMEAYKNFVRAIVERYDGDGIDDMPGLKKPIKYWEILNEPEAQSEDYKCFFQGSGEEFFELVKASYEAIKDADPDAKVVLGGAATLDEYSLGWWREFYSLGGGNYFDIASVHSYGDEEGDLNINDLKNLLQEYGIDKPVWNTEVGPKPYMTKEDDIQFAKAAIRAFANGAEVLFFDYAPVAPVMASIIGDFESVEKLEENLYRFETKNGEVYVAWEMDEIPLEGRFYVVDIYGNVREADISEVKAQESPIYIFKSEEIFERLNAMKSVIEGNSFGSGGKFYLKTEKKEI